MWYEDQAPAPHGEEDPEHDRQDEVVDERRGDTEYNHHDVANDQGWFSAIPIYARQFRWMDTQIRCQ